MIRFDFDSSYSISARHDTPKNTIGQAHTYLCPIKDAVDVGNQYIWERYDDGKQSFYPVGQFDPSVSGKHWQQFEYDLIRTRLMTTPHKVVKFRCLMPENAKFDNQVVWTLDIGVLGNIKHGESVLEKNGKKCNIKCNNISHAYLLLR